MGFRLYLNTKSPNYREIPWFGLYLNIHMRWFYPLNVVFQEFFIKAFVQENIGMMVHGFDRHPVANSTELRRKRSGKEVAIISCITALFFFILHVQYALYYMTGALLLCLITGLLYERDRNIYYVENNHPPIVSKETFNKVQEEMARRASKRKVKEVGTKTESGKYSGKYALTDMLICGHCGTPYRRCTWSKKGTKKIVWRCISRLDYGKKYCPDSPSIKEERLQNAIVECIRQVIEDESGYAVIEGLKHHICMYFGKDDENSTAEDEARAAELIQAITQAASTGKFTSEMKGMVEELNRVKAAIQC
jgi:Predicted metal-dependent membrane protease